MNPKELNYTSEKLINFMINMKKHLFNHEELFKGLSIPQSHAKVIFYLYHVGSSPVSKIGNDLAISKPNMTPIIDKLLSEGLVNRYYDPNDRRIIRVELNEKAKNLFKSHQQYVKAQISERLSVLDSNDLNTLDNCLDTISSICVKLKK